MSQLDDNEKELKRAMPVRVVRPRSDAERFHAQNRAYRDAFAAAGVAIAVAAAVYFGWFERPTPTPPPRPTAEQTAVPR